MQQQHSPPLWPHQLAAVKAVAQVLRSEDRAQLHMACGTGKTRVGAEIASMLSGSIVVWLAPTIELLRQLLSDCADTLPSHRRLVVARTTSGIYDGGIIWGNDPRLITQCLDGPLLVFCSYASFPHLIMAVRARNREINLVIADEAHKTTGGPSRLFAQWNSPSLPIKKRLAMTATPRLLVDKLEGLSISMSDDGAYGKIAYRYPFQRAVDDGVICDIEALVPVIRGRNTLLARAESLVRARSEIGLNRLMSFHTRVRDARQFAAILTDLNVKTLHVNGKSPSRDVIEARSALDQEADVVVTNARIFGEGVNVPALDAIFFCDFKSSVTDITQQIGRAVRRRPGKAKGYVILPPAPQGEDGSIDVKPYARLWTVLCSVVDNSGEEDKQTRWKTMSISLSGAKFPAPINLQAAFESLLYINRVDIRDRAWRTRAKEVLKYMEAGHTPMGGASPHRVWMSNNIVAYRGGKLRPEWHQEFEQILLAMDTKLRAKIELAWAYVGRLEEGAAAESKWTLFLTQRRDQVEFSDAFLRMTKEFGRRRTAIDDKLKRFLVAYEQGQIIDRNIYKNLVSGHAYSNFRRQFDLLRDARKRGKLVASGFLRAEVLRLKNEECPITKICEVLDLSANTVRSILRSVE